MDLSVAVDKLNSMTAREIVIEAMHLPEGFMCHIPCKSDSCIISNLLDYWGVKNPAVTTGLIFSYNDAWELDDWVDTPDHVTDIVRFFDQNGTGALMMHYGVYA